MIKNTKLKSKKENQSPSKNHSNHSSDKRYEEYKDSGVEWIGDIPEHWNKIRLAFVGKFLKGSGISKSDLSEDGLPALLYGDIYTRYNIKAEILERFVTMEVAKNSVKIEKGDILFAGSGETKEDIGKCIVYCGDNNAYAGGDVIILRPNLIDSLYLAFTLNSEKVRWEKARMGKGEIIVHIYSSKLRDIYIPLPPIEEQVAISTYLSLKTSRIDTLISKKEKLIELLQEEHTAIINQAVTKGLDPNVPMKDCGIDWLRKIPQHWEVRKNAWLFEDVDERGFPHLPILQVSINTGVTLREFSDDKIETVMSNPSEYKKASKGYLAFNKMRMWQGAVGVCPVDGLISPDYTVAKPKNGVNPYFYATLFRTEIYKTQVDRFSKGIAKDRNRLYWNGFREILSIHPPAKEQDKIVEFLDKAQLKTELVIGRIVKEIKLLEEYKQTLFSEAVTGKIDVRQEALIES